MQKYKFEIKEISVIESSDCTSIYLQQLKCSVHGI